MMRAIMKWVAAPALVLGIAAMGAVGTVEAAACATTAAGLVANEGIACTPNAGILTYSGEGTVQITSLSSFAWFDSYISLYKASDLTTPVLDNIVGNHEIGAVGGGAAVVGSAIIDPAALGFAAGDELVFAIEVDLDAEGRFGQAGYQPGEIDYHLFMGPAIRNGDGNVHSHRASLEQVGDTVVAVVGFEDVLQAILAGCADGGQRSQAPNTQFNVCIDFDYDDNIFQFEGALRTIENPNPSALILTGLGLVGLGFAGRRRSK